MAENESVPLDLQDVAFGTGVKSGFDILPPGIYRGHIDDIKRTESARKKTPQWSVYLKIDEGEFENKLVFDNWYLTTGWLWKLQQILEAITGEKFREDGVDLVELRDDLIGTTVTFVLDIDEYEGKEKNIIDHYIPPNGEENQEVPF